MSVSLFCSISYEACWIPEIRSSPWWFQWPKLPWLLVSGSQLLCHLILHNTPQVLDCIEIWPVPGPFQYRYLVFLQELSGYLWLVTRSAILHDDRATVDVHVQYRLLFEQFHALGSIHGGARRTEIQTISAAHDRTLKPFRLAVVSLWLQHISCQNAYCQKA